MSQSETNDPHESQPPKAEPLTEQTEDRADDAPLGLFEVVSSTLAAAFGVQSSRNRKRDFTRGRASHFIIIGVVFTALFVVGMVLLVRLVLSLTAG